MDESLSRNKIAEAIGMYGVSIPDGVADAIRAYISLLLRWNAKISLTTVVNPVEILRFHFGESLFAASKISISHGRLADVGSGAGFPGLPLAMLAPELQVILIESNLKKTAFLSEVLREIKLENVSVSHGRMEILKEKEAFDFVTARGIGSHGKLIEWSSRALKPTGRAILWLGERDAAIISTAAKWNWNSQIPIPGSQRRVLLIGSPK